MALITPGPGAAYEEGSLARKPARINLRRFAARSIVTTAGGLGAAYVARRFKLPTRRVLRIGGAGALITAGAQAGIWAGRRLPGPARNEF